MTGETGVGAEPFLHHLGVAEDAAQYVVEVVGDAAGEGPDPLEAPGALQMGLEPRALPLHEMPHDAMDDGVERHPQQIELARRGDAARHADRVETEGHDGAAPGPTGHAGPAAEAEACERIPVVADRHPVDARDVDNAVGRGADPGRELGCAPGPAGRRLHARPAPQVQPPTRAGHHEIGAVRTDARRQLRHGAVDLISGVLRSRVDEAHRYAGDHVLEGRAPLQRVDARLQAQAKLDQERDQEQRRSVQKPAIAPRGIPRGDLAGCDHRAELILVLLSRQCADRPQDAVDRGQEVVEQPPVGEQPFDRSAGTGLTRLPLEFVQLILDLVRRRRRRIQRELQHRGGGGGHGLPKLRRRRTGAEPHKKCQRIVQ